MNKTSEEFPAFKRKCSKGSRKSPLAEKIEKEMKINSDIMCNDILTEENKPIRYDRIKLLLMFEAIVIVDQIIEGNSKLPSLIGVQK